MTWLSGYRYRKKKTIGVADSSISDFTVTGGATPLNLHKGSGSDDNANLYFNNKCKDYFDDIRVTSDDGVTELSFYIRNPATITGELCVKTNVSTSTTDIYIYYGKPSACPVSDMRDTFIAGEFDRAGNVLCTGTPTGANGEYNAHGGITRLHDGTLFACWDSGYSHADNNQKLFYSVSTDQGRTWSAPSSFQSDASYACDCPMPAEFELDGTWTIIVGFQIVNFSNVYDANRKVYIVKCTNYTDNWGSETWGSKITVAGTGSGVNARGVRAKVIVASDGNLYLPTYYNYNTAGTIQIQKSVNNGANWAETSVGSDGINDTVEPVLLELKDAGVYNGDFYILMRSNSGDYNPRKVLSTNYGQTWGSFNTSGLTANKGDALDIIRLSTDEAVVVWCPLADSDDGEIRLVKPSLEDKDITWDTTNYSMPWRYHLSMGSGDYAYPSICEISDGEQIGLVFYMGGNSSTTNIHFYYVPLGSFAGNCFSHSSSMRITTIGSTSWIDRTQIEEKSAYNNLANKPCNPSATKFWLEYMMYTTSQSNIDQLYLMGTDGAAVTDRLVGIIMPLGTDQNDIYYRSAASNIALTENDFAEGTTYKYRILVDEDNSKISYYLYNDSWSLLHSAEDKAYAAGTPSQMTHILLGSSSSTKQAHSQWFWFTVRKYAATEPTWGITGSEEGIVQSHGYIF